MNATAVICEYNPFHLGHEYHLKSIRESAVIAIMSGSFTQRGEAAVLSKYKRAEIAVRCGAALVLELPFPYSSASAEIFGDAGVYIANALGCVDTLSFGSERGDIDTLLTVSSRLCSPEYQSAFAAHLAKGHENAYRTAGAAVYRELYGEDFAENGSNDILALSYLSALKKYGSEIKPMTVMRKGERYNGEGEGFASATSIRSYIKANDFEKLTRSVPSATADALFDALKNGNLADGGKLYPLFASLVRTRGKAVFDGLYDIPDELAARCVKNIYARDTEEFLSLCITKNYSPSRVRRAMLTALMNVRKEDVCEPAYTTVLAANERGRALLKQIKKTASVPVITKPADAQKYGEAAEKAFSLSARADGVWELLCDRPRSGNAMMKERPLML